MVQEAVIRLPKGVINWVCGSIYRSGGGERVYTAMDWWRKIRLEVLREESSKREVLRRERMGWDTLKKILKHPEPPGYRRKEPCPKPKIGLYLERMAQIIEEDKGLPKKQRHTAKRIYERIRQLGYAGKYTQVKEAVVGGRK